LKGLLLQQLFFFRKAKFLHISIFEIYPCVIRLLGAQWIIAQKTGALRTMRLNMPLVPDNLPFNLTWLEKGKGCANFDRPSNLPGFFPPHWIHKNT
jgi:hypothetical protein